MKNKNSQKRDKDNLKYNIFNTLFYLFNIIFWGLLYHKLINVKNIGDYYAHNQFAKWMMEGKFETTYPGYQLMVGIPYKLTGIDVGYISVSILTIFALLTIYLTYRLLTELINESDVNKYHILILSFILNIIQPIFTYSIRPGYCSGNGYVSPTQAVCKPFILLVFLYTYRMYRKKEYGAANQVKLTIVLIASCLIKPLFAMAYVPAMGCLYLFDEIINKSDIKKKIKSYILKVWPLFITGIVLILQYALSFNLKMPENTGYSLNEGAGISVGFLVAWRSVVSSVPLSFIFAYLFPIVQLIMLLILKIKKLDVRLTTEENSFFRICIPYGTVSLLYMTLLYQDNHIADCNFRNAWVVTFTLIFILCASVLYRISREKKISVSSMIINWGVFCVHILMGIALYIKNVI